MYHNITPDIHCNPQSILFIGKHRADLPSEILKADAIFSVCVSTAHFHFELRVKQQHKVDAAAVIVHVQQERVFHHQPAA